MPCKSSLLLYTHSNHFCVSDADCFASVYTIVKYLKSCKNNFDMYVSI